MPVRGVVQRFAFLFLVFAGVALLVASKADVELIERFRIQVAGISAPILGAVSHPIAAVRNGVAKLGELANIYADNERLRAENKRLRQWQMVARQLERDNAQFRHLLNVKLGPDVSYVSARVIADSGGPYVHTLLINAGYDDGVRKGQAVISDAGLAGRITELGGGSARVLLLTDLNSRIPVVLETSRYRAVLAGNNSSHPTLMFLPKEAVVSSGDRVVTSGHGGLFPPGWAIGVVASTDSGILRVQPFTDWHRLEYVSVLRYESPALEPRELDP